MLKWWHVTANFTGIYWHSGQMPFVKSSQISTTEVATLGMPNQIHSFALFIQTKYEHFMSFVLILIFCSSCPFIESHRLRWGHMMWNRPCGRPTGRPHSSPFNPIIKSAALNPFLVCVWSVVCCSLLSLSGPCFHSQFLVLKEKRFLLLPSMHLFWILVGLSPPKWSYVVSQADWETRWSCEGLDWMQHQCCSSQIHYYFICEIVFFQ